jgi:putative endonuclease
MKITGHYFTYILLCSDKSYYIGVTNDLDRRVKEHEEGINPGCYTFDKRPIVLVYMEPFHKINEAISREWQLKGWSRKKKEALIAGDGNALKYHALNTVVKALTDKPSTGSG